MARLNSRRARAAKRRAALTALAKDRNWTLQVETGDVRDTGQSKDHLIRDFKIMHRQRITTNELPEKMLDVPSKRGKVQDGRFKPVIPGTTKRFT